MSKHIFGKPFIGLLLSLFLLVITVGVTFAWYKDNTVDIPSVSGSITYMAQYFKEGDGTKDNPYIIETPDHFYNLAWLQYMGVFQDTQTYFKLDSSLQESGLDMSSLKDSEGKDWLPPIGTTSNPFIGNFDGNEVTIKNLKISSNPSDWAYIPPDIDAGDVGTDIGVFGKIGTTNDDVGVSKFYLKDLTVKTTVAGNVGLIAGNVEGNLSYVGVQGGTIDMVNSGTSAIAVNSDYSLVGKMDPTSVDWVDKPVAETNSNLLIVPSNFDTGVINTMTPVPDCVVLPETVEHFGGTAAAKIIATTSNTMAVDRFSPDINNYYFYKNTNLAFGHEYAITTDSTVSQTFSSENDPTNSEGEIVHIEDEFWVNGQKRGIKPNGSPDWNVTNYEYPKNVIWFKPLETGTCGIAFAPTSQSSDGHMSIYRYVRDSDGKIINKEEMVLSFPKKNANGLGNGVAAYFNFTIDSLTDSEGREYEYAIGKSSLYNDSNVYFYFLKIAGTGSSTGDGSGSEKLYKIEKIDFIDQNKTLCAGDPTNSPEIWDSNYEVHNLVISTDGEKTLPANTQVIVDFTATDTDVTVSDNTIFIKQTYAAD
ncbi:MAG: hypothetical protein ACI4TK_06600 [Agathobacter sp.]